MAFQNIASRLVDVIFSYDFFVSYTFTGVTCRGTNSGS